jgi:hypothetical protein
VDEGGDEVARAVVEGDVVWVRRDASRVEGYEERRVAILVLDHVSVMLSGKSLSLSSVLLHKALRGRGRIRRFDNKNIVFLP